MVELGEAADLALDMTDQCVGHAPGPILDALLQVVGELLDDCTTAMNRNAAVLGVIQVCTHRRRQLPDNISKSLREKTRGKLQPLADAISKITNKQLRNALALEIIYAVAQLGDSEF